jgi:prepilin-type N-terminal cleavage/methylation domain-containing protein
MPISHFFKTKHNSGFTLIELVVVVAIIVIVTGVILTNLPAFRSKISLDLIAEEVAITIRQAQVYGIGTREFGQRNFPSHGIFFSKDTPESFILFADVCGPNSRAVPDGVYQEVADKCVADNVPIDPETGVATEKREVFEFHGGVLFSKVLGCANNTCEELQEANVVFRRPDPEAVFNPEGGSNGSGVGTFDHLIAVIHSPQAAVGGQDRHVVIWNTGQIYACNPESANPTCPYVTNP